MIKSLASYCPEPKIHFKDQEEKEVILLLLRRHLVTNFWWLLLFLALPTVPFLVFYGGFLPIDFGKLPPTYLHVITWTWLGFDLGFFLINFMDWFFNITLITSFRIVDMDYINLLYFRVSETAFNRVEDVTYEVSGLPQILFNYGNVSLQTAGTEERFEVGQVPRPAGVHDLITDLMEASRH